MALNVACFIVTTTVPLLKSKMEFRVHHFLEVDHDEGEEKSDSLDMSERQFEMQNSKYLQLPKSLSHQMLIRKEVNNVPKESNSGTEARAPDVKIQNNFFQSLHMMIECSGTSSINDVLKYVFTNRKRKDFFKDFCHRHFVPEISLFLEAVFDYKRNMDEDMVFQSYNAIILDFIEQNAPYEININFQQRQQVLQMKDGKLQFEVPINQYHEIFDLACWTMLDLFSKNFLCSYSAR
eukprot:CAMPEP_0117733964 /NCGR_PEP_ID=MMETSP0947-20121206/381_1 /TAXON_ID=44440 /ORGANISM="Chattonella subsalsa, Strain CCMP2191" /LENGTH=235 /DNA_ID=CAMNT_0005548631 /DNA_START=784 /DNA_END=1491 /DNA_ORIENTATION=+